MRVWLLLTHSAFRGGDYTIRVVLIVMRREPRAPRVCGDLRALEWAESGLCGAVSQQEPGARSAA
jgi:hypothetical protein